MRPFIHLHLHSEYSFLDSNLKIKQIIKKAREYNMPAVALTDHGNIIGSIHFYREALANGIKPIIGSELYIAPESRLKKPNKGELNYYHLIALVKNETGYRNLCELMTHSYKEGFYRKPRIDKEILEKHSQGLIILSACIQGEIPYLILRNKYEEALNAAKWYREVFKDDYYLEIQNHGLEEQLIAMKGIKQISKELSIPVVATNDVHYLTKEDSDAREILICLQTNYKMTDENRPMKKETDEMYFKSSEEMRNLFSDYQEAVDISFDIASKINFDFNLNKKYYLPEFDVPENFNVETYFEHVCREGFKKKIEEFKAKKEPLEEYKKRLDFEINTIKNMGFPGYFLIVWDIIHFAKKNGIFVGPGRGSVVGSLVAYVMGITAIDPLEYHLFFERFLNPDRVSMPDIDIDFDAQERDRVIEYIRNKYGEENVALIVTVGKMKAKMVLRDAGRALDISLKEVDKIAKLIPEDPKAELKKEIEVNNELKSYLAKDEIRRLMDFALRLEKNARHTGVHAAGVVIAPKRITEFMPLYRAKNVMVTQFEKEEVEAIGLLKMDILGLKNLSIIKNTLREIKDVKGEDVDLERINLNDKKTYKLFQNGDTDGVFQFGSPGMKSLLRNSKPQRLEDLIALNALYRPGPLRTKMTDVYVKRKRGEEKITYMFDELKSILEDTYGIIVFQEQLMKISVEIAGFTMSKADELRKIVGKKKVEKIPEVKKAFIEGGMKRGHNKKKLEELFSQMETFAEYGFNKSHSAAYAYLAYQTAYLKAHYPVFFMSATISFEAESNSTGSKFIRYLNEARNKKMGIKILPPDINKSYEKFRVEDETSIRFGFKGLKNVGEAAINSIIEEREKNGEYKDLPDFLLRVDLSKVNKSVVESLAKAGAFDSFNLSRRTIIEKLSDIISAVIDMKKIQESKQGFLFDAPTTINIEPLEEYEETELIANEKEIAGIYITINPLDKYSKELDRVSNTKITDIMENEFRNSTVRIGGVITEIKTKRSKKNEEYGNLIFEDLSGRIEVLVFKDRWKNFKDKLKKDYPYFLIAKLSNNGNGGNKSLYFEDIFELDEYLKKEAKKIVIKIDYKLLNDDTFFTRLKKKISNNKDSVSYYFLIYYEDGSKVTLEPDDKNLGLKPTLSMKRDIEKLTGENSVEILF